MSDSPDQHWNAEQYAQNARFVADLGLAVVDLLAPQRGERILDLGCGDGALTLKLVERGCIIVGVDASPVQWVFKHALVGLASMEQPTQGLVATTWPRAIT